MATSTSENLPPPKLLSGYGGGKLWMWIIVAFVIHAVIIGGTSVNFLRDFFDPAGAEARHAAEMAKAAPAPNAKPGTPTGAATPAAPGNGATGAAATTQKSASTSSSATKPDNEKLTAEEKKGTPVMKALSDTAKPGETPKKPDDLGIGLDETNPK